MTHSSSTRVIAVPMLARIANFDDLDPLGMEPGVKLIFVRPGQPIPANANVVILPGTKSTLGDLAFLRAQGWDIDIKAHVRRGGHVLGLCGGYQMLGRTISDPDGIDGPAGTVEGLGLLDVSTTMRGDKSTTLVIRHALRDRHAGRGLRNSSRPHRGQRLCAAGADARRPARRRAVAATAACKAPMCTACSPAMPFARAWLANLGVASSLAYEARIETALDALADHLEAHLDIDRF